MLETPEEYKKLGMLDIIRKKAGDGVIVRILIGTDGPIIDKDLEWLTEFPQIELHYLNKSIQTKLTTMVTDIELSLVIEEKGTDDAFDLGLATYSNSDSTVLSYASIFENLWAQSTGPELPSE